MRPKGTPHTSPGCHPGDRDKGQECFLKERRIERALDGHAAVCQAGICPPLAAIAESRAMADGPRRSRPPTMKPLPSFTFRFLLCLLLLVAPAGAWAEEDGWVRILLLGDSTTQGSVPRRLQPEGPHLEQMVRHLLHADPDPEFDAIFGHLPGWFDDRHPNLAGYHLIARETAAYLAPILKEHLGQQGAAPGRK